MSPENFGKLVDEGVRAIPERFLEKLDNVDIVIEDEPTPYQLEKLKLRRSSLILVLYEGVRRQNPAAEKLDKFFDIYHNLGGGEDDP